MSQHPTPRPALRKAPDATVHPAAPVEAESTDADADAQGAPSVKRKRVSAHLRPVVGLGGSTSDVLRMARSNDSTAKPAARGDKSKSKSKADKPAKKGKKSGGKKAHADKSAKKADKKQAQLVELDVKVPKPVRKSLQRNAKARGISVDNLVTSVLEGWLEQ